MLNQDARDSLLASTANNGELITEFHLKNAAIAKTKRMQIIHYFLSKLNGCLSIARTVCRGSVYLSSVRTRSTRIDMETNECLGALTYTTLNAVQEVIAAICTILVAGHNDFKAILLKLGLTSDCNFPC